MTATIQRPLKGSRISTFYPVKELPPLASLDSAFQLQEYISLLVRKDPHDVESITSLPGQVSAKDTSADAAKGEDADKTKSEVTVDQWCWVYEQIRRLAQDLTQPLITTLQQECTRASCPEMKAGEWLYLCVAHGNEGSMEQCCAIDYILHTLDSATALLNSPRAFPSRIQIPESSQRHFASLARRLGRIFAHAYFHHREAFEQAEAESALYARFLALSSKFDLVPAEFLPIPPEAIHPPSDDQEEERHPRNVQAPKLLGAGAVSQFANSEDGGGEQRQHEQQEQLKSILRDSQDSSSYLEPPRESSGSPNPPGLGPEASPRRAGRNRTDTMVFSDAEAQSFAEQLTSRSGDSPENPSPPAPDASSSQEGDTSSTAVAAADSKEEEDQEEEPTPMEVDLVDLTDAETSKAEVKEAKTEASAAEASPEAARPTEDSAEAEVEAEAEPQPSAPKTDSKDDAVKEPADEVPSQPVAETPETAPNTEDTAPASTTAAAVGEPAEAAPSTSEDAPKAPTATPTPDDAQEKDVSKETTTASP